MKRFLTFQLSFLQQRRYFHPSLHLLKNHNHHPSLPVIQNPQNFVITGRGVVYPKELDHMGHMNVTYYTYKFDAATWHLFELIGLPFTHFKDGKYGVAAMENHTFYKSEMFPGETFFIRSGIFHIKGKVIRFHHEMVKLNYEKSEKGEEVIAATSTFTAAHFDRQIHKAVPFPAFVIEKSKPYIIS